MVAELPPGTPGDYCPYEKPFPARFSACACFKSERYLAEGLNFLPAAAVTSCVNLVIARLASSPGTHYGACALGDDAARRKLAEKLRSLAE